MRFVIILFSFWMSGLPAYASWTEARSDNFILVGDVSEKKAVEIVSELEEYRSIIFKIMRVNIALETIPVRIYAVKSPKSIETLTGHAKSNGVYKTTREGPVFILNVSGGFSRTSQARSTAYHEYSHHLIATYTNTIYPRWFNEGFAEFLSTFEVNKKGVVRLGIPNEGRGRAITRDGWMDMEILLGAVRHYPFKNSKKEKTQRLRSRFYAQSWIAVHYIQSTEGYSPKLKAYLAGLDQEKVPEDLFEQSFGITPDAFGDILKAYFKKNRYRTVSLTLDKTDFSTNIVSKKLSKGEAAFHRAEAIRRFRRGAKAAELTEKYYTRAEKEGFPLAKIQASRALMALRRKDEAIAVALAEEAVALMPDDSRVLHVAGKIYLAQYAKKDTPSDLQQIVKARASLKKAMRANPDNLEAHYDYVSTYAAAKDKASKQAVYSAELCANYYKSRGFINANMRLAEILYKNGKKDQARPLLERAKVWSTSSKTRAFAKKTLENMP